MNARLKRPLLAAVLSGALLAGGAVYAGPAVAGTPQSSVGAVLADDPTGTSTTPAADPTTTTDAADPHTDVTSGTATTTAAAPEDTTTTPDSTGTTTAAPADTTTGADPGTTTTTTTTDPGDTTAPKGTFTLNTSSLWVGQSILFTQGAVSDDTTPADQIGRVVAWGDGTTSTLVAGQAPISKQYKVAGTYTVTLTVTDAAGNHSASFWKIYVTVPGKLKLSTTSVYPGQIFTATVTVPSGTTKVYVDWGDGYIDAFKGTSFTVRGYYYHRRTGGLVKGALALRIGFVNKNGSSAWIPAGKMTIKTDSWKPTVKVTKPSKSNRISSWKYIKGTASDKGSGAPYAYVWATRISGKSVYCYTSKKTWKHVTSDAQYDKYCLGIPVKISKGKWSLKLSGLKTGTLYVDARTWDWADNVSKWSSVKVKITRS